MKELKDKKNASPQERGPNSAYFVLKDAMTFIKDLLDVSLKAAVILLFIPAGSLLTFLNHIGWKSLFMPALASVQGLIALLVATLLLFSLLLLLLCAPSLIIFGANEWSGSAGKPQPWAVRTIGFAVVLWIGMVIFGSYHPAVPVGCLAASTLLGCTALSTWARFRLVTGNFRVKLGELGRAFLFASAATIAALITSVVFLRLSSMSGRVDSDAANIHMLMVLLPVNLAGYIPGIFIMKVRKNARNGHMIRVGLIGICVAAYVLFFWSMSFTPGISTKILTTAGVVQTNEQTFMVTKTELLSQLERTKLKVTDKTGGVFTGWVRFSFGDIRLICSSAYDPNDVDFESFWRKDASRKPSGVENGLAAGRGCVEFTRDEIRLMS